MIDQINMQMQPLHIMCGLVVVCSSLHRAIIAMAATCYYNCLVSPIEHVIKIKKPSQFARAFYNIVKAFVYKSTAYFHQSASELQVPNSLSIVM